MKVAQRNKALLLYRFLLVNVDNARTTRSDERPRKKEGDFQVPTNEGPQKSTGPRKRQWVDLGFHLLGVMAGFELVMVFTNWTTISDNSFTNTDIVDIRTLWVRFAGSLAGIIYVTLTCVSSYVGARKRALRTLRRAHGP